jgi:subtilisin family serine protease
LTEAVATFHHPGSGDPSIPPWHLPGPAPAGTSWDNFEVVDHGLMVAGIIRDIAPQAEIHLIRVLGSYGVGYLQGVIDVLKLLPSALHVGSKKLVVNLSLVSSVPPTSPHGIKLNLALQDACNWLTRQGVLVVASSGNFGHGVLPRPDPAYPARFPDVFSVSTVRRDRTATQLSCKAAESPAIDNGIATFGGDVLPASGTPPQHNPFIDLGASPVEAVVGVFSKTGTLPLDGIAGYTNPTPTPPPPPAPRVNTDGWVYWSGSSFATPIISGIAARLWRVNPTLPGAVPPPGSAATAPTLRQKIQAIGKANHLAYPSPSPEKTALDGIAGQLLCEVIEAVQS